MRPLLFAAFLCVISLADYVSAQVPPANTPLPGERDLIRDRQERLLEEQRRRLEELKQLPGRDATEAEPIPEDQRCFDIRTITVLTTAMAALWRRAA